MGLTDWPGAVFPLIQSRLSAAGHGDFPAWSAIIDSLPNLADRPSDLKEALLSLSPWRKGPFEIGGITIDAEWRSDRKWARVIDAIDALAGRRVLDVGCGNGYYVLQMKHAGAAAVIGIDPTLLYVMQFLASQRLAPARDVYVLPLRLHELPAAPQAFDTTFSMGVLYHQRSPIDHLCQLRDTLRPGGQLVLETIYLPGVLARAWTPPDRYARMKNVWLLPTIAELETWLLRAGFQSMRIVNQSQTTTDEQRRTEWMTFDSLADALDPQDAGKTIEGWPAPHRVVLTAFRK